MPTRFRRNKDEFYKEQASELFGTKLQNPDYRTDLNAQEDDHDAVLEDFVGPYPCIVEGLEVEVDPVDDSKFKVHAGRGWVGNMAWTRRKRRRIVVSADVSSIEPASSAVGAENVLVARYQETTDDSRTPDWPAPGQTAWDTTATDSYSLLCVIGMENVQDGDIPLGMFRGTGIVNQWKVFDHAPYRARLSDPADKQVQPINWCLNSKFTEAANPSAVSGVTIPDGWGILDGTPEKCIPGYGSTGQEGLQLKLTADQGIAQDFKYYRRYILRGREVYLSFRIEKFNDVGAGDDPVMFRLRNAGGTVYERLVNLDEVNPGDRIWLRGTVDEDAVDFGIEVEHGGGVSNCWFILYDMMLHAGNSPNVLYIPTNCYDVEVREYFLEDTIVGDFVPPDSGMAYPALVNCHGARLRVRETTGGTAGGVDTFTLYVNGEASALAVNLTSGSKAGGAWCLTPIEAGDELKVVGSHTGMPGAGLDAVAVLELWRWKY